MSLSRDVFVGVVLLQLVPDTTFDMPILPKLVTTKSSCLKRFGVIKLLFIFRYLRKWNIGNVKDAFDLDRIDIALRRAVSVVDHVEEALGRHGISHLDYKLL